jgi:protein TonB
MSPGHPAGSAKQTLTAAAAATAPSPINPVPAPAPDNGAALAALEARIGAAVNAAKFYPPAARLMHRQGRVAVSFAYRDGSVEQVALAQPSQVASLDNAALAAVRRARYPMPPPSLGGQSLHLRVWVTFALVQAD